MRVAAYIRVSTADQNCQLQIRELREFAARLGWEIEETYEDVMSGARSSRPGLNRLWVFATVKIATAAPPAKSGPAAH